MTTITTNELTQEEHAKLLLLNVYIFSYKERISEVNYFYVGRLESDGVHWLDRKNGSVGRHWRNIRDAYQAATHEHSFRKDAVTEDYVWSHFVVVAPRV